MNVKVNKVSFMMRQKLQDYEHEELMCDLSPDDDTTTADELLAEARRVVIENSTAYKKKLARANALPGEPIPPVFPG